MRLGASLLPLAKATSRREFVMRWSVVVQLRDQSMQAASTNYGAKQFGDNSAQSLRHGLTPRSPFGYPAPWLTTLRVRRSVLHLARSSFAGE